MAMFLVFVSRIYQIRLSKPPCIQMQPFVCQKKRDKSIALIVGGLVECAYSALAFWPIGKIRRPEHLSLP